MKEKITEWLDEVLEKDLPDETAGVNFNLYEEGDDKWSFEIVATSRFDENDEDWACDEISDLDTRETPFSWIQNAEWDEILSDVSKILLSYLSNGKYAYKLKNVQGVGVGFVDGDIEILYKK